MDAIPKFDHQGPRITNIQICIYTNTNTNTNTKEKLQWWIDGCHPQVWPSGTAHYDRSPLEVLSNFPKPHKFPRSDRLDYKFGNIYFGKGGFILWLKWLQRKCPKNDQINGDDDLSKMMTMRVYRSRTIRNNVLSAWIQYLWSSRAIWKHLKISTDRDIISDIRSLRIPRGIFSCFLNFLRGLLVRGFVGFLDNGRWKCRWSLP